MAASRFASLSLSVARRAIVCTPALFGHQFLRRINRCRARFLWDLAPPRVGFFLGLVRSVVARASPRCQKKWPCRQPHRGAKASRETAEKSAPGGNAPYDDLGTEAPAAVSATRSSVAGASYTYGSRLPIIEIEFQPSQQHVAFGAVDPESLEPVHIVVAQRWLVLRHVVGCAKASGRSWSLRVA